MKTYTIQEVRNMCEFAYGSQIADSTWRKWRTKLGMNKSNNLTNNFTENQTIWLVAYARLKYLQPNRKHTLKQVIDFLKKVPELEIVNTFNYTGNKVLGKQLPQFIENQTGKRTSIKTLYRKAKLKKIEFSINRMYTIDEARIFLAL